MARIAVASRIRRMRWAMNGYHAVRGWLGLRHTREYAIAIYRGDAPWSIAPVAGRRGPVLTYRDVTDVPATYVADPFLLRHERGWFMFFEVLRADTSRGEIAVASSEDGVSWRYGGIVLAEPYHLSYPYVFQWQGETYMVPETFEAKAVRLYRASRFPTEWVLERELLTGTTYADASVFRHDDRWWLFVEASARDANPYDPPRHDTLRLFHAPDLTGPWVEHPRSPIVASDPRIARPAGRVVVADGRMVRFAQDCRRAYGRQVFAREILELSPEAYRERPIGTRPVLGPGVDGWNRHGMHHVDAHQVDGGWIASVDGWTLHRAP